MKECNCGTSEEDIKENGHFYGCPLIPDEVMFRNILNIKYQSFLDICEKLKNDNSRTGTEAQIALDELKKAAQMYYKSITHLTGRSI